jgi:nucleotide-binding universal stress UspA family protein
LVLGGGPLSFAATLPRVKPQGHVPGSRPWACAAADRTAPKRSSDEKAAMRTYLVVIDDSPESEIALRFAARRAVKTGGGVEILTLMAPPEFVQWGGVMATIEDEARQQAEALVMRAAGTLLTESGITPSITVRQGEGPKVVREMIAANPDIAALVLGAAPSGAPGPLVTHFTGADAGTLSVPVMIVPGSLDVAAIDRLS